jgi:hypothetical protein
MEPQTGGLEGPLEARGTVRDVWAENKKAKNGEGWNVKMLGTVRVLESPTLILNGQVPKLENTQVKCR